METTTSSEFLPDILVILLFSSLLLNISLNSIFKISKLKENLISNSRFTDDDGSVRRENGISGGSKDGEVSWTSPEGEQIQFSYVADENGYQASGSHDPVPVPLPNGDPNGPGGARNNLEIWADLMQIGR